MIKMVCPVCLITLQCKHFELCLALLWLASGQLYSYLAGILHWYPDNPATSPMQPWRISVYIYHTNPLGTHYITTKQFWRMPQITLTILYVPRGVHNVWDLFQKQHCTWRSCCKLPSVSSGEAFTCNSDTTQEQVRLQNYPVACDEIYYASQNT